jgi:hypothetical protein
MSPLFARHGRRTLGRGEFGRNHLQMSLLSEANVQRPSVLYIRRKYKNGRSFQKYITIKKRRQQIRSHCRDHHDMTAMTVMTIMTVANSVTAVVFYDGFEIDYFLTIYHGRSSGVGALET